MIKGNENSINSLLEEYQKIVRYVQRAEKIKEDLKLMLEPGDRYTALCGVKISFTESDTHYFDQAAFQSKYSSLFAAYYKVRKQKTLRLS
jgi:hypothetical protein